MGGEALPYRVHLIRDVLDKQLVDRDGAPLGKADGLLVELTDGDHPPRVTGIEVGFPVLGRRLHPRLERWVRAIGRRFGVRRGRTTRFRWRRVREISLSVKLDADARRSPTTAWERWWVRHVVRHIPGSGA